MSSWRVYIAPILSDGTHSDYIDVSSYAIGKDVGTMKRKTEKDEFDIGVAPLSSVSLKFNNSDGKFTEAGQTGSLFLYRRKDSKVKITYLFGEYAPICGTAIAGLDVLGPEITTFEGLLSEKDIVQDVINDTISVTALGFESIFDNYQTYTTNLNPSFTLQSAFFEILNRAEFTSLLTVDFTNINLTYDAEFGDITDDPLLEELEETTVREALDLMLEASASILYIEDSTVYITDRIPNDGIQYYFYGQASNFGLENVQNISDYKSGISRTFNVWKWEDTTLTAKDTSSIDLYGILKHDNLDFKLTTLEAARQLLLNTYRDEFSVPKQELKLTTYVNVAVFALKLFDKVSIDYPNVPIGVGAGNIPIWNTGSMVWQDEDNFDSGKPFFTWPEGLLNIEIEAEKEWKIIGIEISSKKDLVTLELREV